MINNTSLFLELVDEVKRENQNYFTELRQIKERCILVLKEKIFNDFELVDNKKGIVDTKPFEMLIKNYILSKKDNFSIETQVLDNISTQLEIEYLLNRREKADAQFLCAISDALTHYGIYREDKIVSFQHVDFWKELIKMICLLNMMNQTPYSLRCDEKIYDHPVKQKLPKFANAIKKIELELEEKIKVIDSVVVFEKLQEEEIISKIEKKLSQLHLFNFLRFVFNKYQEDKSQHKIEFTIPYKYIINILVKNISKSTYVCDDRLEISNTLELLTSFITLYQLKEDQFEMFFYTSRFNVVKRLKKQVLYSNFYPLYALKTNTLIEYIENIVQPSINEDLFFSKFGFTTQYLINFFRSLDVNQDDIISFNINNIPKRKKKILDLFSIDAKDVNQNYSTINKLPKISNQFIMNPILKYKNEYYVIGFKYFKMNFYNVLVEKIRKNLDKGINDKIGLKVDIFVEKIFTKIRDKFGYQIYSGKYSPPKKANPESDLLLKSEKEIILIENKNKYLTNISFSGSESDIFKDFVLSFVYSMKQLLTHEKNLKKYKTIKFDKDKRELIYSDQTIMKISVSTNNWYRIMNNHVPYILTSINNVRFNIEEDKNYNNKDQFIKANNYLDDLNNVICELKNIKTSNIEEVFIQAVFLPLELIVDKYNDDDFIEILKSLIKIKMNTDNIMNIYDYIGFIRNRNK